MIDAKLLLQKYPDNLFCQSMYAFFLVIKNQMINASEEAYREPLDRMFTVYDKLKKNNFDYTHPTDGMASSFVFAFIPKLYYLTGDGDKGLKFTQDNIKNICADGTYQCLNAEILTQILQGFYGGNDYENSIKLIDIILSQTEEELIAVGNTINAKKAPYYKSGMIYMKWGQFDKAIEGFNHALNLTFQDEYDNKWWNSHYLRRLGLVYYFKGDYKSASKYYLDSYNLYKTIENIKANDKFSFKALCSYGYMEELLENRNVSKTTMTDCSNWVMANRDEINDEHDAYETIWQLYLYNNLLDKKDEALKYLEMAYEIVGTKTIEKYRSHREKDTYQEFFWSRDIIKTYENSIHP